jgi:hypothetical protein
MGSPDRGVFCQYDPLLGYDGVPGLTANWPTGFSISMNADGNRDRPSHRCQATGRDAGGDAGRLFCVGI